MSPLSVCLSLIRMCEQPAPGSEGVIVDLLRREMASIYAIRSGYDYMAMLAAFQAFLFYAMCLFFRLDQGPDAGMREVMMNLQDLAAMSCRHGLVCAEEQQRARPRWEAWVVAEAKRRTLFTMYLFDSVLSSLDGLPTFLGTELTGLPAPASKVLWQATERGTWETSYSLDLADWPTGKLRIDELWPVSSDTGQAAILEQCNRVDRWLEGVDEYGTMLYAVTSCTHGT
ncbi:C6 finger domain protein, putative [Metarhizium acridum CQMa 102]|uniref:C6 finger domain protein, putative n=2 Tax=Metarhizium acridum TaxID=92637 RepID=E9DX55_METAQ|nr:C6 finger domain protein, putative [Metarhizium acridum CQMa 102]EFY91613.1 C6 finger domain protein, putative [Metarhizium acridum CQMa 102]